MKATEIKLCGLPAVQARWKKDPASFVRLFFDQRTGRSVGAICRELAAARKVYRCVEAEELAQIAGSHHHGGIVAVVLQDAERAPGAAELGAWAAEGEPLLVLDRIGNPHNLGALVRTAAFLGVRHVVIPDSPDASRANEAAYRVSEGGLEAVSLWVSPDLPGFLRELSSRGYEVVGAATRDGKLLRPGRGVPGGQKLRLAGGVEAPAKPVALVLGNEEQGMAPQVAAACTRLVTLAGSGAVESLNVSVAGALMMWELLGPRFVAPQAGAPRQAPVPKGPALPQSNGPRKGR